MKRRLEERKVARANSICKTKQIIL